MKKLFAAVFVLGLPVLASAQNVITNADSIIDVFYKYSNIAISALISLAVVFIVWGVVKYAIIGADSEDKRKEAKNQIIWGVIGLAVILSIWGLVRLVTNTFNTGDNRAPVEKFPEVRRTF